MTAEHVVLPDDEARHTPDGDDLWNESYYCDFVRDDGSIGGWKVVLDGGHADGTK